MKVLLVVPDVSRYGKVLDTDNEVYIAGKYSDATVLIGQQATHANLLAEIQSGEYHVVQFSTEAVLDGRSHMSQLALTDGELHMGQLGQMLARSSVQMVFLNACNTSLIGAFLVYTGAVEACIVTNVPLPDAQAWEVPLQLYQVAADRLANGERVHWGVALDQAMRQDQVGWYGLYTPLKAPPPHLYYTKQMLQEAIRDMANRVHEDPGTSESTIRLALGGLALAMGLSLLLVWLLSITG